MSRTVAKCEEHEKCEEHGEREKRDQTGAGAGAASAGVRRLARVRRVREVARAATRDAGMATSEYAVGLIAATGFAAVLGKVLTSSWARAALQSMVGKAFGVQF